MLPVQETESIILNVVQPFSKQQDVEIADLSAGFGRILAIPAVSQLDFPHWDNSAMDGYAVRCTDVQDCPITLAVVEEIPAGSQPQKTVQPGQAARIFTGALMPEGADAVVMQEHTAAEGDKVTIRQAPQPQEFVRHRASFYQAGHPLLPAGIALGAPEIAILAAAQCTEFSVYRRPRVAILATGNELVAPDRPLQPGQIVDSNQYALAAFVRQNGGIPISLGIVRDRRMDLQNAMREAIASADMVLSTGGVSVGKYDYVEELLQELGGDICIRSVAIKPGKPLTVATFPPNSDGKSCLYFGIPGNPVSALVSCWRFVQPALKKMSGLSENCLPRFISAQSRHDLRGAGKRETYLWGQLHLMEGRYEFSLAGGSHSSGNLINLAQTTGLAVVPVGTGAIAAGEKVKVLQL